MTYALEARNLHASYRKGGEEVLKGVDFILESGQSLGILGPNGCGKTTLLRCISGLIPFKGELKLMGDDPSGLSRREIARRASRLLQTGEAYFPYTVEETVLQGRYSKSSGIFGGITQNDREVLERVLDDLDLNAIRHKQLNVLSGGQQQKVFLGRCLAQESPVLLLDEPMNHLDIKAQSELTDHLQEWRSRQGHSLVGVYHDIRMAARLSDRIMLMKDGRTLYYGDPAGALDPGRLEETFGFDAAAFCGL
ncbi:MAG: ABC transporter ATP-binding protein [Lachnospiraceae bacterium]|nr:ABC transporter ATP-binding protein [Lachnospiraceae bacterium]